MKGLNYDIKKYVTKVKMSSKKRLLVEGKDDKSHIQNLIEILDLKTSLKVDTAELIKGDCRETSKNNRAKIDKIHYLCKNSNHHDNLFFLKDREFFKFDITTEINDLMSDHEMDGNLSWTIGHSFENYFLEEELICEAYRFLCGSGHKTKAIQAFRDIMPSAIKLVAGITLAAKDLNACSYPCGVIQWQDFAINNSAVELDLNKWSSKINTEICLRFKSLLEKYLPIIESTDDLICSRICRGHTSMLMLQRIFSACLYHVIAEIDEDIAKKDANAFSQHKEPNIASALCESWLRKISEGKGCYPEKLFEAIA